MKTYILFSSLSRCVEDDFQIVATGHREKLKKLAHHFGVSSWTIKEGGKINVAKDGRLKIVESPVWED
jgi:hypothetical protein